MNTERSLQCARRALQSHSRRQCRYSPSIWQSSTLPAGNESLIPQHRAFPATHQPVDRQPRPIRSFTTSPCLQKKGGKAARDERQASGKDTGPEDPSDFSGLESDIAASIERLRDDLSKLRAGGRFNPEVLENLKVQPDKNNKQLVKLSDLAQVIPKGRTVQILVGEKDHIRPITSAIQASNLSLQPQPDPTGQNPLLLVINIPPPTTESRRAVVNEATKAGEKAGTSIKDGRGKQQKKLRAMQSDKTARPDDLKKAGDKMEKIVQQAQTEVKKLVDNAKKVLESG